MDTHTTVPGLMPDVGWERALCLALWLSLSKLGEEMSSQLSVYSLDLEQMSGTLVNSEQYHYRIRGAEINTPKTVGGNDFLSGHAENESHRVLLIYSVSCFWNPGVSFIFYLKQSFMLGFLACHKPATSGVSFPSDLGEISFFSVTREFHERDNPSTGSVGAVAHHLNVSNDCIICF